MLYIFIVKFMSLLYVWNGIIHVYGLVIMALPYCMRAPAGLVGWDG